MSTKFVLFVALLTTCLSSGFGMNVKVGLKTNQNELERVLLQVSDPSSSLYGKHFSHADLHKFLTPSAVVIEQVVSLFSQLSGHHVRGYGDVLEFQLPDVLAKKLVKEFAARKSGSSVFRKLFDFVDVIVPQAQEFESRVDNQLRSFSDRISSNALLAAGGGDPNGQKTKIYKMDPNLVGTNPDNKQMVWGPGTFGVSKDDLQKFYAKFGLKSSVADVSIPEYKGTPGGDNWGEGTLDASYITGMAPGVKTIVLNTNTSSDTEESYGFGYAFLDVLMSLSALPDNQLPKVLSLSLGSLTYASCKKLCDEVVKKGDYSADECVKYLGAQRQVCMFDSQEQSNRIHTEVMKLGVRGVTILAASGDGGSHFSFEPFQGSDGIAKQLNEVSCEYNFPTMPSSSPYVTSVGGISYEGLFKRGVTGWSRSGGCFSLEYDTPDYQKKELANYLATASSNPIFPPSASFNSSKRAYPDVAALAAGVPMFLQGELVSVGGTSAAAPAFAGVVSIINDHRLNQGLPSLGFLNPRIYQIAADHPGEAFLDITTGSIECECDKGFVAAKGFDVVTGLGSPLFPGMLKYLGSD